MESSTAARRAIDAGTFAEAFRITAENKAMYINAFVRPVAPEESQYPRRWLFTSLFALGCLALWGLCCGLVVVVRNHATRQREVRAHPPEVRHERRPGELQSHERGRDDNPEECAVIGGKTRAHRGGSLAASVRPGVMLSSFTAGFREQNQAIAA